MRRKGEEPRGARIRRFGLRHQIVAIMLLCYLLPALVLGLFSRFVLLRGIREKADAALLSESAHAWTMTVQKIDRAVELSKEAVYDEDLALFWEQWKSSAISNAEYLRLSRKRHPVCQGGGEASPLRSQRRLHSRSCRPFA